MNARIVPDPDRYRACFKDMTPSPGYGERKVTREKAKVPLLADLPGVVRSAEEYQASMTASTRESGRRLRRLAAEQWREVRRWVRAATAEEFNRFLARWEGHWHVPHTAHYALDLARAINRSYLGEGPS